MKYEATGIKRSKQAGWRGEIAAAIALLFGLVLLHAANPLLQVGGGLLALAGGLPLIALSVRILRQWRRDREADFAEAQRKVRKAARRERDAAKKDRVHSEQDIADAAERKRLAADALRERAEREREAAETQKRMERQQRIEAEARRWQSLTEAPRRAELTDLLQQRGMSPLPNATDADELRFAGSNRVALYLSADRQAELPDLERLHALRLKYKASKAYLIAPGGFAPDAVRRLPDYTAITLADANFLINWQQDF